MHRFGSMQHPLTFLLTYLGHNATGDLGRMEDLFTNVHGRLAALDETDLGEHLVGTIVDMFAGEPGLVAYRRYVLRADEHADEPLPDVAGIAFDAEKFDAFEAAMLLVVNTGQLPKLCALIRRIHQSSAPAYYQSLLVLWLQNGSAPKELVDELPDFALPAAVHA